MQLIILSQAACYGCVQYYYLSGQSGIPLQPVPSSRQ